jgi:hypothetical protein
MNDTSRDKLGIFILAGITLVILGLISMRIIGSEKVDANAIGLLGVIVAGLIAFLTGAIAAVRGYSMSAQLGKVTDQLAASGPATTLDALGDPPVPTPVDVAAVGGKPVKAEGE